MKLSSFLLVEQQMVQSCIVIPINQWATYRLKFPWSGCSFSAFISELDTKTFVSSTFNPIGSFSRTVWKYNAYSWPICLIWLHGETRLWTKQAAQHMWKPRTPPQSGWGSPFFDSSDSFPPPLDRWIIWTQGSTHILSIPHVAPQCNAASNH